ncbi:hypothetical protein BHE74_00041653, partial [Ensete ventricosum]
GYSNASNVQQLQQCRCLRWHLLAAIGINMTSKAMVPSGDGAGWLVGCVATQLWAAMLVSAIVPDHELSTRPRPFPTPHLYRSIARHDLVAPSTKSPSDITYSTLGVCNPPCFVSSDSDRGLYLIRRWCQARYASLVLLGTYFSDFLFYSYLLPCCLGSAQDGLNMNLIGRSLSQCKRSHFRLPHCTIGSMANMWFYLLLLVSIRSIGGTQSDSTYLIGLGSYDITGPAADVNMMGYANTEQIASGVHFRLKARTFIVAEPGGNRVVFVNLDACMASQLVTIKVLERLKSRYSRLNYLKKVATLSSNLYGALFRELLDASINRSPSAYLNNPAAERSKFKYDVDKEMTLLKFVDDEWGPIGSFNWFATHGTSMSRTNSLISGDNKGAAARFMEDWAAQTVHKLRQLASSFLASGGRHLASSESVSPRVRNRQDGKPKFVSAFCQSNCGDVSPNVLGTFCIDTGLPCDFNHSTCNGKNELCYGRGPGYH